jgi:hypothetical protein
MATAICPSCATTRPWSAGRGSRLADLRCFCGSGLVRAQWRDGRYQVPLASPTKPRSKPEPDTAEGTIFVAIEGDASYRDRPARAGDLAVWTRNGERGVYDVRILAFRGRRIRIELLRSSQRDIPRRETVWTRHGFLRLLPS